MRKSVGRLIAVFVAVFGLAVMGTGPAQAATPDGAAQSACGSGYYIQRKATIGWGASVTAYLLYNSSSHNNCAVTVKHSDMGWVYGTATGLGAGIQAEGGSMKKDQGNYKYYAGPVYLNAPGKCVRFWAYFEEYGAGPSHDILYTSPYGNCG
ncbi:serine/threonine protein kinase [Streptomyces sp. NPDC059814]|uniref:serine/threonine protein kinase n=1 Tax=Streptomyces sp. NPDC059814 TaxID=3346959 RepID=UPI003648B38B